jgi:DNA-binding transcriptional ArsR family regulator
MKSLFHPSKNELQLSAVLYALSDPIRMEIVKQLANGEELTCGTFLLASDRGKSTMTHHFKVLRDAGIIRTRIDGREHFTSLRRDCLDHRFPGLIDSVLNAMSTGRRRKERQLTKS